MQVVGAGLDFAVAPGLGVECAVGAVTSGTGDGCGHAVQGGGDAADAAEGVAGVVNHPAPRIGDAQQAVARVVGVRGGVGDVEFSVHLRGEIAKGIVTVTCAPGGVGEAAQFADTVGAARSNVVGVGDVFGRRGIVGRDDAVERVVAVRHGEVAGVGVRQQVAGGVVAEDAGAAVGADFFDQAAQVVVAVLGGGVVGRGHLGDAIIHVVAVSGVARQRIDGFQQARQGVVLMGGGGVLGVGFADQLPDRVEHGLRDGACVVHAVHAVPGVVAGVETAHQSAVGVEGRRVGAAAFEVVTVLHFVAESVGDAGELVRSIVGVGQHDAVRRRDTADLSGEVVGGAGDTRHSARRRFGHAQHASTQVVAVLGLQAVGVGHAQQAAAIEAVQSHRGIGRYKKK